MAIELNSPPEEKQAKMPTVTPKSAQELKHLYAWQKTLLPFMVIVPTVLAGVFIFMATTQMMRFNKILEASPDTTFIGKTLPLPGDSLNSSLNNNIEYIRWLTLTHMEQQSIDKRYKQGGLLLMSRIFTKYLGFFTGMVLAIVGAVFIIGKLSEDYSSLSGSFAENMKFDLISSSPGIIFGVLGTILMLSTILKHNDVVVQDSPLYLNANTIISMQIQNLKDTAHVIDTSALNKTTDRWEKK